MAVNLGARPRDGCHGPTASDPFRCLSMTENMEMPVTPRADHLRHLRQTNDFGATPPTKRAALVRHHFRQRSRSSTAGT
jgi:hypothetical protein